MTEDNELHRQRLMALAGTWANFEEQARIERLKVEDLIEALDASHGSGKSIEEKPKPQQVWVAASPQNVVIGGVFTSEEAVEKAGKGEWPWEIKGPFEIQ